VLYTSVRELFCRPEKYGALLERRAGIAPSPVAELTVILAGCGAVAVVEVGTAGVVVVTGGWRLENWQRWAVLWRRGSVEDWW
jgi:hypothetical protein